MELNKTRCNACGNVTRWHSYKWADSPERQEHNRTAGKTCGRCGSTDVKNFEDDETMEPYRHVVSVLSERLAQPEPATGRSPERRTPMDVRDLKGKFESIKANADHAGKGLDGGDSLQALDALTKLIETASAARVEIAKGTTLEGFYAQKAETNS